MERPITSAAACTRRPAKRSPPGRRGHRAPPDRPCWRTTPTAFSALRGATCGCTHAHGLLRRAPRCARDRAREGCYVFDEHGNRYLDGLSALYCVNIGHGRTELGEAALEQTRDLGFYTNWSYAHPPSIELAARIAGLAPGNLNRVFFTSGGSEAVESAWKLAKAYHRARGENNRYKLIARNLAYHGVSMGALAATGLTPLREPFEPLTRAASTFPTPTPTARPPGRIRCGRPTRSSRRSNSRAPTRSPR